MAIWALLPSVLGRRLYAGGVEPGRGAVATLLEGYGPKRGGDPALLLLPTRLAPGDARGSRGASARRDLRERSMSRHTRATTVVTRRGSPRSSGQNGRAVARPPGRRRRPR